MNSNPQLLHFLQNELAVSSAEVEVLLHHPDHYHAPAHMLLWQYGLISLNQLTQVFDWLETQTTLDACL